MSLNEFFNEFSCGPKTPLTLTPLTNFDSGINLFAILPYPTTPNLIRPFLFALKSVLDIPRVLGKYTTSQYSFK